MSVPIVEDAIRSLVEEDWARLHGVGHKLARKGLSDGESLLFEALERTLSGRRQWSADQVDFVGHLTGVMRSLASHESKRHSTVIPLTPDVDLIGRQTPESELVAREQIRTLRSYLGGRGDREALAVFDAMKIGCDGPTIRAELSLSQTQLETIVRRIRRSAERMLPLDA